MVYLIDFENTSVAGLEGIENLKSEDSVVVFYTEQNSRISMDVLSKAKCSMSFQKIPCGKQAVDTCIIVHLGFLVGRTDLNSNNKVAIVSKDNGYRCAVEYVQRFNNNCNIILLEAINGKRQVLQNSKKSPVHENEYTQVSIDIQQIDAILLSKGIPKQDVIAFNKMILSKEKNKGDHKNKSYQFLIDHLGQKGGRKVYNTIKQLF